MKAAIGQENLFQAGYTANWIHHKYSWLYTIVRPNWKLPKTEWLPPEKRDTVLLEQHIVSRNIDCQILYLLKIYQLHI